MVRVIAGTSIPRGCVSELIFISDLRRSLLTIHDEISIHLSSNNEVTFKSHNTYLPIKHFKLIPIADDIHTKNMELFNDGKDTFRLKVIKDLKPGDYAELWFSEDVLAQLNMPFLTPNNIKGRKNYACLSCGVHFEKPNPLKIHLFLSCECYSVNKFWLKFLQCYKDEAMKPLNLSIERILPSHSDLPISRDNVLSNFGFFKRCISEPPYSAFRPYNTLIFGNFNNNDQLHIQSRIHPSIQRHELTKGTEKLFEQKRVEEVTKSLNNISVANAVEIENFATNWGKSINGHLCLYCGKVYSRKYGLKIHIRTHTGYKPLQCKYCFRPFGDPSNLNKHVRLHAQNEMPYSCSFCGKMMVRKRDLERHTRSRHGDFDFKSEEVDSS